MSSPPAENSRSRIEGNSSATRFGVVHLGSRNMEFEGCPAARCASSLANAATISLAVAAASAGHRKGVKGTKAHRRCNRHRQTLGLPGQIVNAADRRYLPPFGKPAPIPDGSSLGALHPCNNFGGRVRPADANYPYLLICGYFGSPLKLQ